MMTSVIGSSAIYIHSHINIQPNGNGDGNHLLTHFMSTFDLESEEPIQCANADHV